MFNEPSKSAIVRATFKTDHSPWLIGSSVPLLFLINLLASSNWQYVLNLCLHLCITINSIRCFYIVRFCSCLAFNYSFSNIFCWFLAFCALLSSLKGTGVTSTCKSILSNRGPKFYSNIFVQLSTYTNLFGMIVITTRGQGFILAINIKPWDTLH